MRISSCKLPLLLGKLDKTEKKHDVQCMACAKWESRTIWHIFSLSHTINDLNLSFISEMYNNFNLDKHFCFLWILMPNSTGSQSYTSMTVQVKFLSTTRRSTTKKRLGCVLLCAQIILQQIINIQIYFKKLKSPCKMCILLFLTLISW